MISEASRFDCCNRGRDKIRVTRDRMTRVRGRSDCLGRILHSEDRVDDLSRENGRRELWPIRWPGLCVAMTSACIARTLAFASVLFVLASTAPSGGCGRSVDRAAKADVDARIAIDRAAE